MHVYIDIHVHMKMHIYVYIYICLYVYVYIYSYIYIYIYVCIIIYIYVYTYIYVYVNILMYAHTHTLGYRHASTGVQLITVPLCHHDHKTSFVIHVSSMYAHVYVCICGSMRKESHRHKTTIPTHLTRSLCNQIDKHRNI